MKIYPTITMHASNDIDLSFVDVDLLLLLLPQ